MLNGRHSRVCAALLVVAGAFAAAIGSDANLQTTAAGRHAAAWLDAFNSGDTDAVRAMYEDHLAELKQLAKQGVGKEEP